MDEHKIITLDIHHEALKDSNLSFEVQNKLFHVILRGEGNLQLNTAGTFKSSQEAAILNYGTPEDKTFHVPYEGYYDSANTIKGFTTEKKSRSFNRNEQRHFPTCNLDWLYNAPNIKKMFINHERKFMLTKPTSALSCPEELWVFHGKVDSNFLSQLQMSNMKKLVLGKCGLNKDETNLDQIGDLTELTQLDLSYCHLNTIPQKIYQLPNLEELNIQLNQLKELPKPVLDMLKRDTEIWAGGNALERPPQIMCGQYGGIPLNYAKVLKYFEDLEKFGETHSNRLRVVVTVNSKAGKTSIINGLLSGLSSLEEEQIRTCGIEIRIFYVSVMELDMWDYLGQECYQPIHNFYLHCGSSFLLVVDIHTYETTDKSYFEHVGSWIANIRAKILRPVFIVVANKTDTFYAVDTYYEIIPDE